MRLILLESVYRGFKIMWGEPFLNNVAYGIK
ncbi:MAG: hypothetical protein PHY90_01500 [Desulfitobacteriaceae bacterium]|nr:hypothetical protein [Desulfitobacteriaceae bacterium]